MIEDEARVGPRKRRFDVSGVICRNRRERRTVSHQNRGDLAQTRLTRVDDALHGRVGTSAEEEEAGYKDHCAQRESDRRTFVSNKSERSRLTNVQDKLGDLARTVETASLVHLEPRHGPHDVAEPAPPGNDRISLRSDESGSSLFEGCDEHRAYQESNSDEIKDSMSLKKGIASPTMNEMTQPPKTMAIQVPQPTTVCS